MLVTEFIPYYLKTRKSQYKKTEIPNYEGLVEKEVLIESNSNLLIINYYCEELNNEILNIAEKMLNKKISEDLSEAFLFIESFQKLLLEEYNLTSRINPFSSMIRGLEVYVLSIFHKQGDDLLTFCSSLKVRDKREKHLLSFELGFLKLLPYSSYSSKDTFEVLNALLKEKELQRHINNALYDFIRKDLERGIGLLEYGLAEEESITIVSILLVAIYNTSDINTIDEIVELDEKYSLQRIKILARLNFKSLKDLKIALGYLNDLNFEDIEYADEQCFLINSIIKSDFSTDEVNSNLFNSYRKFLNQKNKEFVNRLFKNVLLINGYENDRYQLLLLSLPKLIDYNTVVEFFYTLKDPKYLFNFIVNLYSLRPANRFPIRRFSPLIKHYIRFKLKETEQLILSLFENLQYGRLGVKIILEIHQIDFLKLDKEEFQINAIKSVCNSPHSFNKLLPYILPLRNSMHSKVPLYLQQRLSELVFNTYHETVYNQIKEILIESKEEDVEFLKPIKESLNKYYKLKEKKESINDLNPYENEKDLMNLYYRLEAEERNKSKSKIRDRKDGVFGSMKTSVIVRGNSFKVDGKTVYPMARIQSEMLVNPKIFLNPDLFDF